MQDPKESRQDYLKNVYKFNCKCLACTENWSSNRLPKLKVNRDCYELPFYSIIIHYLFDYSSTNSLFQMMKTVTPELNSTIQEIVENTSRLKKIKSEEEMVYSRKIMRDIVFFLESLAEKVSTHCDMYKGCLDCLDKMFFDVFGSFHSTIPDKCFTS